jgi:hypothetical protein
MKNGTCAFRLPILAPAMVLCVSAIVRCQSPPFEAAAVVADNQTRFEAVLDYDDQYGGA